MHEKSEEVVKDLIRLIGDDPTRPGLLETPSRVYRSWGELFAGYRFDPKYVFKCFEEPADEMVVIKDVEFYSTCEHHMLPFFGKAHIAYIPNGRVIGASKLPRLLDGFSRRLQIQERICTQVTAAMDKYLEPLGSACRIEARHLCMCARGVRKQHSAMVTTSLTGVFKDDPKARAEWLATVGPA
jgi:GTP cyclohydrolase I